MGDQERLAYLIKQSLDYNLEFKKLLNGRKFRDVMPQIMRTPEYNSLKAVCTRNILERSDLVRKLRPTKRPKLGFLECTLFVYDNKDVKHLISRGASYKGTNLEQLVEKSFNKYFELTQVKGVAYRNITRPFSFQPYDIVIYSEGLAIFLECKNSGVTLKENKDLVIKPSSLIHKSSFIPRGKTLDFIRSSGVQLYFVFPSGDSFLILHHSNVSNKILHPGSYLSISRDPSLWPSNLITLLLKNEDLYET